MSNCVPLTIVVATFNASKYLRRCLESILVMKYKDWECLIVDGVSTDETLSIVAEYEAKDVRFRHISEKDNGIFDAFNKGWIFAKGEWIYYLGSDDEMTEDGMESLMSEASKADNCVGVVSGGVVRVTSDGMKRILMTKGYIGCHQSMVMRRYVLKEFGGFSPNYKILADYHLFIELKTSKYKYKNIETVVAKFYSGGFSEKISSIVDVSLEKYDILKKDCACKYPLLIVLYDAMRTIGGKIYHAFVNVLKRK